MMIINMNCTQTQRWATLLALLSVTALIPINSMSVHHNGNETPDGSTLISTSSTGHNSKPFARPGYVKLEQSSSSQKRLVTSNTNHSSIKNRQQQQQQHPQHPIQDNGQQQDPNNNAGAGGISDNNNSQQQMKNTHSNYLSKKICIGTSNRLSAQGDKREHYYQLAERYRNCAYVIGNLELTWLEAQVDGKPTDMSFLENIREITGYLLIGYLEVDRIRMPNLQIIRGRDLFRLNQRDLREEFSIFVIDNNIKTLELPNLREVLAGSAGFMDNRNLQYIKTIQWEEILNSGYKVNYMYNNTTESDNKQCDSSCQQGSCWGEGPGMCQKLSKLNCSPQCSQGRCFGPGPRDCCHLFCAGGCTGPKQTDCLACKHFYDDGECIQECPSMHRYNPTKFVWETDPKGKYAFGATCVKECPEHLLRDNGACVRTCPPNKRSSKGECVPCSGPCPKNCQGVDVLHSGNIDQFVNCTVIEGSITILDTTFSGYAEVQNNTIGTRYEPMHPNRLSVFKSVTEITGYLSIQASHPDFRDLSSFKNLRYIGGRQTTDLFHPLSIIKTSLISLGLRSLSKVKSGKINIEENKDLCFTETIDWNHLNLTSGPGQIMARNNADPADCRRKMLVCHEQCSKLGCWGPRQDECLDCNKFKLDNYCVADCEETQTTIGYLSYRDQETSERVCRRCHPECGLSCNGPEANHCTRCRNVKDGPYCVAECPSHKFNRNGVCQECHPSCSDGCTGPLDKLGEGGCNSCHKVVFNSTGPGHNSSGQNSCLKFNESCPKGYYQDYIAPQLDGLLKSSSGKPVCRKCHHRCKSCTGMGTHVSVCECSKYKLEDQCEDSCPRDYFAEEHSGKCMKCSNECNGCTGPTEANCTSCRVYKIFTSDPLEFESSNLTGSDISTSTGSTMSYFQWAKFNCTSQCPADKPHRVSDANIMDIYCSDNPGPDMDSSRSSISFYVIISAIFFISFIVCFFVYHKQNKHKEVSKLTNQLLLSGFDVEPLNQSNVAPNLAPLRSIKKDELRIGKVMGSGVGGTVYQGFWMREADHKVAVAIKVLNDNGQPNRNKEFLDEAYMMASVQHPNLVRLLAVCMTPKELMLVTQLMPLGCLLSHVKRNKYAIGSKNLLEWSKQIARGMAYLEEKRMVHRDLALRNVLLRSDGRAVISDFGLAKFLDIDQTEYHSGGGKLPIRWLAPECLTERKFTHKSDVWAFGVTVWELVSFGKNPFDEYETVEVPEAIVRGARLEQPKHMSTEVYKLLYSCWFYSPEDRPNFKQLAENFVFFARDPRRYLDWAPHIIDYPPDTPNSRTSDQPLTDELGACFLDDTDNTNHEINHDDAEQQNEDSDSKASTAHIIDLNNNPRIKQVDSAWSSRQTVSSCSAGRRSEQPTDTDDYLMPSPFALTNEDKFTKFLAIHENSAEMRAPSSSFGRDPPHSAGLIGISNEEYFMTHVNFSNQNGGQHNSSAHHIPNSLV